MISNSLIEKLKHEGFQYPASFLKAIDLNLVDFDLWYIMDEDRVVSRIEGLNEDIQQGSSFHLREGMIMTTLLALRLEKGKGSRLSTILLQQDMSREMNMMISGNG